MALDDKKTIFGWCMYDWANSAFATTIMAGFFPIFFKQYCCTNVDVTTSTFRLGLANSLAGIVLALSAPILGAIADKATAKKKFLMYFAFMGIIMSSALYMVSQGNWLLAVFLYIFASIGFSGGNIFYDALIVNVASEKKMDIVSALGFSLGYLGGGILFAFNVWMKLKPQMFGFADDTQAVKFSFVSVGLWWAIFSIPLFIFVKEPGSSQSKLDFSTIKAGFVQIKKTFYEIRQLRNTFLFLLAYWFYIDGVDTIIRMAVDYGISIGLKSNDLIIALLVIQFIAFPAALAYGYLGNKIGAKRAIFIAIAAYLFVSVWAATMHTKKEFYILAGFIGLFQGGIQALSRSYFAKLIPPEKSAKYFGFFNMVGKFAAIIGPLLMGVVGLVVKSIGYDSDTASRTSILSISLLFITGGTILYFVDSKKGKEELKSVENK